MNNKKIILTLASVVIILVFFSIPLNNTWFNEKIFNDNFSVQDQMQNTDVQYRMEYRFGSSYAGYMSVKRMLDANKATDVLLLMPPVPYIHQEKVEGGFESAEPAVFYYFTGIKSVCAISPNVHSANWVFVVENHKMWLRKVTNQQYLDNLVQLYKKYYQ
jgi:hypothetical protein